MRQNGVRRVPVVDLEGRLVGIFSMDDAVQFVAGELADLAALSEHQVDHEHRTRTSHHELAEPP